MSRNFIRGFRIIFANCGISSRNPSTLLGYPPIHLDFTVRSFSRYVNQKQPSVVSYLIKLCGLSAESANCVSKRIDFQTLNVSDSVLSLLVKDYGFTIFQISVLLNKAPQVLLDDPTIELSPKLQFLSSIGISSSDLLKIVCLCPRFLTLSFHHNLIPTYDMLKIILGSDKKVIQSLKSSVFANCFRENVPINISLLNRLGVALQNISFLLTNDSDILSIDPSKFNGNVNKVIEMGIRPPSNVFVSALHMISKINKEEWQQRMKAYKSWGLSEEEILSAFREHPYCMNRSAKSIKRTMDFIVNKMGYKPADAICFPLIFCYSLKKRIIPRFSVTRVLELNGLVKANMPISTVTTTTEKCFLNNYVTRYIYKIPELLSVYQTKVSIQDLDYEFQAEKHV